MQTIDLPDRIARGLTRGEVDLILEGLGEIKSDPVAAAIGLRGWFPFPGQAEVLRALDVREARVKQAAIACGTGWGKTDMIAELHSSVAESVPGSACLAASRSQEQANLVLKRLLESWTLDPVARLMVADTVTSPFPKIVLKNGSYITARTTKDDCKALRGPEWDLITLDEAGHGDEYAWHFLTTRVRKSNGPVIAFSSPGEEWFEDLYHDLEGLADAGRDEYYAYHAPGTDNPHLSADFFARMHERLPDVMYRMEVLAEFVGGNVHTFKREHLGRIFDPGLPVSSPPVGGHRYGQGWDMGIDSTAAVGIVHDATSRDLVIGAHMETHPAATLTWPVLQRRVEGNVRAYPGRKALDYTGVGKAAGQNLRVHVRDEEQFIFTGATRYDLCVEAMKFVETMADTQRPVTSFLMPAAGPWAALREQMRKHKLYLARKQDSKSAKDVSGVTWDELDAFLLSIHAVNAALSRSGSLLEYVA
jgi:hypothetical protein